jgi:hypothetical protein
LIFPLFAFISLPPQGLSCCDAGCHISTRFPSRLCPTLVLPKFSGFSYDLSTSLPVLPIATFFPPLRARLNGRRMNVLWASTNSSRGNVFRDFCWSWPWPLKAAVGGWHLEALSWNVPVFWKGRLPVCW